MSRLEKFSFDFDQKDVFDALVGSEVFPDLCYHELSQDELYKFRLFVESLDELATRQAKQDLEDLCKEVFDEGYDEGHAEGYDDGHTEGHEEGREKGYDAGLEKGYANAKAELEGKPPQKS